MQEGDFVLAFYESLPRVAVGQVVGIDDNVVMIQLFVAPGEPTPETVPFAIESVSPLETYIREQPQGVLLAGTVVLQSVNGILQFAELVNDLHEGDTLPLLRLYVGARNGDLTGIVTPTPLSAIRTPRDFLEAP